MKNTSTLRITALFCIGLFLARCNSQSSNMLAENVIESNLKESVIQENAIAGAQKDTYSDYQKFIKEAYTKLEQNETAIVKLNHDSNLIMEDSLRMNVSEIEGLKISHNTLKSELDNYVQNGTGNWQTFKAEFYCGFNQLELACNNTSEKFNE